MDNACGQIDSLGGDRKMPNEHPIDDGVKHP